MKDDRASADRTKGSVKEAIGKLTGDARVEAEGKAQKTKPQHARPTTSRKS